MIIYDTDCELWYPMEEELKGEVIRMPYTICDKEYFYDNGRNTDFKGFYDLVRAGNMPTTSALNPQQYLDFLDPLFAKGEDILYISFSSQMSSTFDHLEVALNTLRTKYPTVKFTRFDTKSICWGGGYQVYYGAKFYNEGHTIEETVAFLEDFTNHVSVCFMADDLNHLRRGGRLSGVQATLGTMIGLKPMLNVTPEGKLSVTGKAIGNNKALAFFMQEVRAKALETDKYPFVIVDADNTSFADRLEEKIKIEFPNAEVWRFPVGPVIGTHCGPGTVGLIFHATER